MKVITKTELAPAEEVEVITYGCDHCDFTSSDEDDVEKHHAKDHACKKQLEVEDRTLYWFDTKEDAKAWLDVDEYGCDYRHVDWSEPGWYMQRGWTEPCRRGCCTDSHAKLYPVEEYLSECEYAAREAESKADRIRRRVQAVRREVDNAAG